MQDLLPDHEKNRKAGNAKKSNRRLSGITYKNKLPDAAGNEAIRLYKLRCPLPSVIKEKQRMAERKTPRGADCKPGIFRVILLKNRQHDWRLA